jgi:hypothetical protein
MTLFYGHFSWSADHLPLRVLLLKTGGELLFRPRRVSCKGLGGIKAIKMKCSLLHFIHNIFRNFIPVHLLPLRTATRTAL